MLLKIPVSPSYVIVDEARLLPRYWATAWSLTLQASALSKNTYQLRLRHLDYFYRFCDSRFGLDAFDAAVSRRDGASVASMLEAYFHSLTDSPQYNSTAVKRWDDVRAFVGHLARIRAPFDDNFSSLSSMLHAMGRIRVPSLGRVHFIRAIPWETLDDLLAKAHPESTSTPFKGEANRWRNWLALSLMLTYGLRRGEALILSVNSLKREMDVRKGQMRYYLVVENNHDYDPRSATPSIKTERSFRRVPVTKDLADLWDFYVENFRAEKDDHTFLLTSRKGAPWAAESLTDMMAVLSRALSDDAKTRFFNATGGKESVTAHDLRHTAATLRYQQFTAQGLDGERTKERMRALFGWSYTSRMPEHYARAAIEEDLAARWNDLFDQRLTVLKGIA